MQGSTPPISGYSGYPEDDDQYKVPLIAKLLHALPHYNITFHRINNTFRPSNDVYLEVCTELCRRIIIIVHALKAIDNKIAVNCLFEQ